MTGSGDHIDGIVGVQGRDYRVYFLQDNDFIIKGVFMEVNEERPVLRKVWEMMRIMTI